MPLIGQDHVVNTSYKCLAEEALPSVATSAQVFASAPAGTKEIVITIRSQSVTYRCDGSAATAGANGCTLPVGTHTFQLDQTAAKLVRMIQDAATTTGWIQYWGIK